ncbi:MAG TPA: glucose 1-dehydrogenase [Actinomycetota bacterium]|jgi:threonine dehydrogenase-like Zn-dependent dehydrogenase|nr:glucose 1-dehydrogenase [Actinomycetota bacterium]
MKAIVVNPGKPNTAHLRDVDPPTLESVPDGRGVLVKILRVGLDGTDHEINAGEYGATPPGADFLILGHESFGVVQEVGPNVTEVRPGDHVVAIVRQPGSSIYDQLGMADMTTDDTYHEHGISLVHGFLTEFYVEAADRLIHIPDTLGKVGVLLEPTSIIEKGIAQASELQRRLRVWQPKCAAVLGAGTVGLLATMGMRLRGIKVVTLGLDEPPYLNSDLIEALGATYISTKHTPLAKVAEESGPLDLIYECTGFSPLVFEAMQALGKNGVLVLASVTGGDRKVEVPSDAINQGFVLGNKAMVGTVNANREHFEAGVRDLTMAQALWPGWLERLLTHRVDGLSEWPKAFELLGHPGVIKVFVEVAEA